MANITVTLQGNLLKL